MLSKAENGQSRERKMMRCPLRKKAIRLQNNMNNNEFKVATRKRNITERSSSDSEEIYQNNGTQRKLPRMSKQQSTNPLILDFSKLFDFKSDVTPVVNIKEINCKLFNATRRVDNLFDRENDIYKRKNDSTQNAFNRFRNVFIETKRQKRKID